MCVCSAPPQVTMAPSEIMRRIKGRSASKLLEEFPVIKKRFFYPITKASRGRNASYLAPPRTDLDVQFSSIWFLGHIRFRVKQLHQLNTLCFFVFIGSFGLAIPKRSKASLKTFQLKLLRFPPRRFNHLNAHSIAQPKIATRI